MFGRGGALDNNQVSIKSSYITHGKEIFFGGFYDYDSNLVNHVDDEIVYLGYLGNHWGHFLMNFSTRLWFAITNKNKKFAFIINVDSELILNNTIKRFFELCDLSLDNLLFINKPTTVKSLIIPEESYSNGNFCSYEFLQIFNYVAKNITPSIINENLSKKVYFSRLHFNQKIQKEFGLEIIDNLFAKNGYDIFYPEELSLDDQIFIINSCSSIALITGTLVHNLLFATKKIELVLLNKVHIFEGMIIDTLKIKNLDPIFVDCYAMKYPVRLGFGPFLFVNNINFKNFIKDNGLTLIDDCFTKEKYLRDTISSYSKKYEQTVINQNKKFKVSDSISSNNFYNPNIINDYIDNYLQYESYPKLDREVKYITNQDILYKYEELKEQFISFYKNFKMTPIISYQVHCSNIGWLKECSEFLVAGYTNKNFSIEAFRIFSPENCNLLYRCFYKKEGWSKLCSNNEICGTIGKSKVINGISIMVDERFSKIYQCLFRVFVPNAGWSCWYSNGMETKSMDNGFVALQIYIEKFYC